jgi:hypothetical protein
MSEKDCTLFYLFCFEKGTTFFGHGLYKLQEGSFLCGMPVKLSVSVLYYCKIVVAWADINGFRRRE